MILFKDTENNGPYKNTWIWTSCLCFLRELKSKIRIKKQNCFYEYEKLEIGIDSFFPKVSSSVVLNGAYYLQCLSAFRNMCCAGAAVDADVGGEARMCALSLIHGPKYCRKKKYYFLYLPRFMGGIEFYTTFAFVYIKCAIKRFYIVKTQNQQWLTHNIHTMYVLDNNIVCMCIMYIHTFMILKTNYIREYWNSLTQLRLF